jgi:hypothetical protein
MVLTRPPLGTCRKAVYNLEDEYHWDTQSVDEYVSADAVVDISIILLQAEGNGEIGKNKRI